MSARWRLLVSAVAWAGCALVAVGGSASVVAGEATSGATEIPAITDAKPAPGHSLHGEVFDDGPRQQARQMVGMGDVHLQITTDVPLAQELFDQGIGQLHGFWYFEAERSFRQAATLDADCAMAYWGMAMANFENQKRATGFIEQAVKFKPQASATEALWIDGLDTYIRNPSKADRKNRWKSFVKSFEKVIAAEPENIEAKAFLAWAIWKSNSSDLPLVSHEAVDALLQQVLAKNPLHPGANHYVIHLWDQERPARALKSAAVGGQSAAGIAHLWHMPGHTFSNLHRYADAAWQQEAAIRVDHAYMQRDRVLPYQIHNYAHNFEWLIRNLCHLGRAHDAVQMASHLIDLPRHPDLNSLSKGGSCAAYGRQRLIEALTRFEMWDELLAADQAGRLELTANFDDQVKRLRLLGVAHFGRQDVEQGKAQIAALEVLLASEAEPATETAPPAETAPPPATESPATVVATEAPPAPSPEANPVTPPETQPATATIEADPPATTSDPASPPNELPADAAPAAAIAGEEKPGEAETGEEKPSEAKADEVKTPAPQPSADQVAKQKAEQAAAKQRERKRKLLDVALAELRCYLALAEGRHSDALEQLKAVGDLSKTQRALIHRNANDLATAEKLAREAFEADRQQVHPLAVYVDVLASAGKTDEAAKQFEILRGQAAQADLDLPAFARVSAWAAERGITGDWRSPYVPGDDVGVRPPLESLGPPLWHPWSAPAWSLPDAAGNEVSLGKFAGKPVVVIFYLGYGCLHCVEQLEAFGPMAQEFRAAGIELVGISTDSRDTLGQSLEKFRQSDGSAFPIPLASNSFLDVFKSYRAFDDFENQPLHGTFLIDGQGVIRWQEVSFRPFDQPKFLLEEGQRLLRQPRE